MTWWSDNAGIARQRKKGRPEKSGSSVQKSEFPRRFATLKDQ
jgi:hypothetical protein